MILRIAQTCHLNWIHFFVWPMLTHRRHAFLPLHHIVIQTPDEDVQIAVADGLQSLAKALTVDQQKPLIEVHSHNTISDQ